jgi:hypothetical protein
MKLTQAAAYVIAGVFFTGCPDDPEPPPADAGVVEQRDAALPDAAEINDAGLPPPEVCPRGFGEIATGDINGDGVLDVADAIALQNNMFRGMIAPACRQAADWNNDGRVEADDASRITTYLVTGAQQRRTLPNNACDSANYWPDGQCAPLALEIQAPNRVTSGDISVKFAIRSPVLEVQGWSLSLYSDGCTITSASPEGTTAAEVWDDPPGIRHLGYNASRVVTDGAISYVILSFVEDITLDARAQATTILTVELQAGVPASGCTECKILGGGGLSWLGEPIDTTIVAAGYAYQPAVPEAVVQVCAP